ncbi:MAG: Uma2 family endonuclease [Pirellulaceae bacterium]
MIRSAPDKLLEEIAAGRAPSLTRLSADQYHQMIASGILPEANRLELIDGLVVHQDNCDTDDAAMNHGRKHAAAVRKLQALTERFAELGYCLQTQLPVRLSDFQEPEPDAAVLRGAVEDYIERVPCAEDVVLVIEVAHSSLEFDRSTKQRIYAAARIPVYAIVNLREGRVELYDQPDVDKSTYCRRREFASNESLSISLSIDAAFFYL